MWLQLAITTSVLLHFGATEELGPIVELPSGKIRGLTEVTAEGKSYHAFKGIPYAAPPVGSRRFKPPAPHDGWKGVLNATSNTVICFQVLTHSEHESEDCLFLNVFTPHLQQECNSLLPVMIHIYGGAFIHGSCPDNKCGPDFFINSDVIVVTFNYRTGPFGFLSTQDLVIPGNSGLWDQHAAIKWVHDNIRPFGGDPEKVTIFGQSAGSASITYQTLNPKSKAKTEGLFRAAICQSGSFLSPWSYQRRAREFAFRAGSLLDGRFAGSDNSSELLQFLQGVSARDLIGAADKIAAAEWPKYLQATQGSFWAPTVEPKHEGAFFTEKMYGQLKKGNFVRVPTIIGFNSEEALFVVTNVSEFSHSMEAYDEHLDFLVPDDMNIKNQSKRLELGAIIRRWYTGGKPLSEHPAAALGYLSDDLFTRPLIRHAEFQSEYTPVYFYQFAYHGPMGANNVSVKGAGKVEHGEELQYMFHMYGPGYDNADYSSFPESDVITQKRIVKIWTDFAKYLNPTPSPSDLLQNIIWPTLNAEGHKHFLYVDINKDLEIKDHPRNRTFSEWVKLYDSLKYDDFDTY